MGNLVCKENDAYSEFVALMDRTSQYTGQMVDSMSYLKANLDGVASITTTKAADVYNSAWQLATTKLGPTERDMISAGEESDQRVLYNATCSSTSSTEAESPRANKSASPEVTEAAEGLE
ncbi:hypothetical protein Pmar_PMAR012403 [Perkinsus marinus ATCC 50983]|uniref:Uncharacterized protein n=1 Tax=Perkinsus marinus (strain ATCC 50983 / TXsc) TaxID=423536 RepID=C5K789_PERM5|nr:hypothetical protein Pmar_PMAR012403 [Perkinsus marinus ATCC 50983]EER19424.1 hypothetical protein Pmar_PMAR012403 [Perkinsus marinus ATCC 50983]|eukprot:XP_002787628.1 hypothetical protein Pmar_PMAR012403 [Perkinsus marinus ATCC 50983]